MYIILYVLKIKTKLITYCTMCKLKKKKGVYIFYCPDISGFFPVGGGWGGCIFQEG